MSLLHVSPTPISPVERLDRLAAAVGLDPSVTLLVKRDDRLGPALGGNKERKLRHLLRDAEARNCDVVVTGGGPQSNHAVLTAAAALRRGMRCRLVLSGNPPTSLEGNVLVHELLGSEIDWIGDASFAEVAEVIEATATQLAADGNRPYVVPLGGSSPVGCLGYVEAGRELLAQADPDLVVLATGSGGTHAGLAVVLGHNRVVGVDVGALPDVTEVVAQLTRDTATHADLPAPDGDPRVLLRHGAAGYGIPTDDSWAALLLAARTEGLLLDVTYTSKALAGLIDLVKKGQVREGSTVVLMHTGGAAALFTQSFAERLAR